MGDLVTRLHEIAARVSQRPGTSSGAGGQTVEATARSTFRRISDWELEAVFDAADEIARLRTALAEAEAERDRLRNAVSRYVEATEAEPAVLGGLFRELRALTRPAAQPEGEHD